MEETFYYQDIIKRELAERLSKNARYSLRAFAKSLEMDAGDLSRILNGTKNLTPDLSKKILSQLSLNTKETQNFLFSMAQAYEHKGVKRKKKEVKSLLQKSKSKKKVKDLTIDTFKAISDWYHYAILQLIDSENFKNDNRWIAQQLNITEIEVKLAIERLFALELIKKDGNRLARTYASVTTGDRTITSSAFKTRIKQVTEKSLFSLQNDSLEVRDHNTMTISIDPKNIPVAKEMIQEFMDKLESTLQTKKKQVYEIQINLFPLQRGRK